MKKGQFISIEGIEGAGKSTALTFIQAYLQAAGITPVVTREPGGTEIAEEIRKVLLYPASNEVMQPQTELLLMFASRAQHVNTCIKPALSEGQWVVSDRYVDASFAYQGGGRGLPLSELEIMDQLVVGSLYPGLTLLLDVSPEVGCQRAERRMNGKDRIENERLDFFERVRSAYLARAKNDPKRIKIIDASLSIDEVKAQIEAALAVFLQECVV